MAITRAQIAKQLLAQGGRIGLQRGGRRGDTGQASQSQSPSFGGGDEGGGLRFRGKINRTIPTITPKQKPRDDIFFGDEPMPMMGPSLGTKLKRGVRTTLKAMGESFDIPHDYDKLHNALVDLELNVKVWDKLKWKFEI